MKGVSEVVSYVLVMFVVITAVTAAYFWSISTIEGLNEPGRTANLVNQMVALDYIIRSTAHGDINFTNTYEIYHPNLGYEPTYIELRPQNNSIVMQYNQKAAVLGRPNMTYTNTNCSYNSSFVYDNRTGALLYQESNNSRVFKGAKASGAGTAEIMICYPDIQLTFMGNCISGKIGPRTIVYIRKIAVNGTTPVVAIDLC